jgi:hypothetical protein
MTHYNVKYFNKNYWKIDKHVKGGSFMKPNIGRIDALCRISMGFTVLAWSTAKLVRKPNDNIPLLAAMMGGMKVGEGITRFCPLVYMAEHKMVSMQEHTHSQSCHHDEHQHSNVVN